MRFDRTLLFRATGELRDASQFLHQLTTDVEANQSTIEHMIGVVARKLGVVSNLLGVDAPLELPFSREDGEGRVESHNPFTKLVGEQR